MDSARLRGYRLLPGHKLTRLGAADVDSGLLMVADPCRFFGEPSGRTDAEKAYPGGWEEIVELVGTGRGAELTVGTLASTGGDGSFPVLLETDATGAPRRIIVDLQPPESP